MKLSVCGFIYPAVALIGPSNTPLLPSRDTYVERVPGETSNDYSDRLIRQAALWYSDHLAGTGLRALLLTDDRDNLRRAKKAGVPVMRGGVTRGTAGRPLWELTERSALR